MFENVYFSETDLFDSKSVFNKKGEETVIPPHFQATWQDDHWVFVSKSGKTYEYYDLVNVDNHPYGSNPSPLFDYRNLVDKASKYAMFSTFFVYYVKMVMYYNSFPVFEQALLDYKGKPKGRDVWAEKEREKFYLNYKDNY